MPSVHSAGSLAMLTLSFILRQMGCVSVSPPIDVLSLPYNKPIVDHGPFSMIASTIKLLIHSPTH